MSNSDEEFVPEEEAEEGPAAVKKLREKLKKTVGEKQEYLEGWQRARADFANFKREEAVRVASSKARVTAATIEGLLPALDALELASRHGDATAAILERQFLDSLKKIGVERLGSAGEEFDPARHEALGRSETSDKEKDHTVVSVELSGYSIGEIIIRPAHVIIATHHG
ncbi:nucleotide exchange factor GrpE [Candidatus Adlerbacteria bacterium RIFCSPHIGHO2_01_FULL_54_23]|uniref:Protein GrpE n=3 Tax=Candidatus Adleribacteriota TaxID=1752736 RepID=A0A1F4Y0U0_9BACT|nr:MAG: Protein GrpE [Candidatus Adlerbacteria bacterium GW2011_GWA1_54_10]KKW37970.1 MAG: Protein GrpE [Candidatus Adlerbacteria bacterium GW2011_GWB1_54_7]OGC78578.1 MAG: nucleotide exchange factor GrpE [Candidatus Adlerbacteria bacterium RIFCSPHIGHO2_01_FULL_54_23]OGC87587.1 MAG: nucleotide exchange factor GrpE [Candidatus Adlerbacteria bacterium RIFCSPLOWO2_01_FULL_54_16]